MKKNVIAAVLAVSMVVSRASVVFAEETEGKHLTAGATTGFFGAESLNPSYNWDSWIMSIYGISENLWYEEVVPHHSIFTFYVLADSEERLSCFSNYILNRVVQFGGGATIGYGFCKITAF